MLDMTLNGIADHRRKKDEKELFGLIGADNLNVRCIHCELLWRR